MYENRDKDWTPAYYENGEYWGYPNRAAEFYLDKNLLPITPHTWKINNNNQNESDQLVDGNPITIAKLDKAQTFSMDFIFLHDQQFYRNRYSSFSTNPEPDENGNHITTYTEVKDLTDYLWNVKVAREPVVITIIYPFQKNYNLRAILDDYTYTQSADNASDYEFSLTFTEYHEALNQEVDIELQNTLIRHNLRALRGKGKGDSTEFVPQTYETETGKHTMTWEEMKAQIEAWLKVEYKKLTNEEMNNFDECFKKWWNSDENRAKLHCPDTPREFQLWWNDFMEKSKKEQSDNKSMADFEAWLNVEVRKLTDKPPSGLYEKFKLWWESDETRKNTMHMPATKPEIVNWWNDFMTKSEQERQKQKALADIRAWLNSELTRLGLPNTGDTYTDLQAWWASSGSSNHCPTNETELLSWWTDFMQKSEYNEQLKQEIIAWLNVEIKKITNNPPSDFKSRFELWWNSDPNRKATMHCPSTDAELLNWWIDFKDKSQKEQERQQKLADIKHWLNNELKKLEVLSIPEDFWDGFKIWWESDPDRKANMHMPDNDDELFNWWDDFQAKNAKWGDIKAWLDGELKKIGSSLTDDFYASFKTWWDYDPVRKNSGMHCPDNDEELFKWWDDFIEKSK